MPEGDTVWLTARRLDAARAGHALVRTDFRVTAWCPTCQPGPVPGLLAGRPEN